MGMTLQQRKFAIRYAVPEQILGRIEYARERSGTSTEDVKTFLTEVLEERLIRSSSLDDSAY
jgi:hypothetical protein